MMNRCYLQALALACCALPASAAGAADFTPSTTVGVGVAGESLDAGQGNWREGGVRVRRDFAPRTVAELSVSSVRRFGLSDSQLSAAGAFPIGEKIVASVDATYSTTHRILPRSGYGAALQWEFARAWLLHGGARTVGYDGVRVNQGLLTIEHYFRDYSAALSWRPTRAFGVTAHGVSLQTAWYYGERDSVGLTVASGREASSLAQGVILDRVKSVGVGGRHQFSRAWSFNYGLSYTRQSDLYTRKGASLGLAYTY